MASADCAPGEIGGTLQARRAESDGGYAVLVRTGSLAIPADTSETPYRSSLRLYENGVALQPPHSAHVDIRNLGKGRFSHWYTKVIFSASDNSDPRTNGRTYTYCGNSGKSPAPVPSPSVKPSPSPIPSPLPSPTPVPTVKPSPSPIPQAAGGYEDILKELVGFGSSTTGGKGGTLYTVTSLADSGTGTLREAATQKGAVWIRFGVSGTIALKSEIKVASNKTIDGRGADVTISGNGLSIEGGASNVIITYVKIRDTADDAIRLYSGGSQLWVHHVDITNTGDGAIDTTEDVTDITVSYSHVYDVNKAMLIGASSYDGNGANLRWTAHHNYFDHCVQRLPNLVKGKAHSYNNVIAWYSGSAMEVHVAPAQLLNENNVLVPENAKLVDYTNLNGGAIRFTGTYISGQNPGLDLTGVSPSSVFDPRGYYDYAPETANAALEASVKTNAGWKLVAWPGK